MKYTRMVFSISDINISVTQTVQLIHPSYRPIGEITVFFHNHADLIFLS